MWFAHVQAVICKMADSKQSNNIEERSSSTNERNAIVDRVNVERERSSQKNKAGKGKQSEKSAQSSSSKDISVAESRMIMAVTSLQNSIEKQTSRMNEQDKHINEQNKKIKDLLDKITLHDEDYNDCQFDEECDEGSEHVAQPCCEIDPQAVGEENDYLVSRKRKTDENTNNNSRFSSMAKRFKAVETCDAPIDSVFAENLTELFRKGIDEEIYNDLIKEENNARPENCEGLCVVQTYPSVWDIIGPVARINDKKMQGIETSVVKGATILAKLVDKMEKLETEIGNDRFSKLIDECNDVLALLGHANNQINLARKDLLRPVINRDYNYLCNHRIPYTKFWFGDDISKSAKEIEDSSKLSYRLTYNQRPYRGGPIRRR